MCLTCGCGEPENRHGQSGHITMSDLRNAAAAARIKPKKAARNLIDTVKEVRKSEKQLAKDRMMSPPKFGD